MLQKERPYLSIDYEDQLLNIPAGVLRPNIHKQLERIVCNFSHNYGTLALEDVGKACEIAFRIQPKLLEIQEDDLQEFLENLSCSEGNIRFCIERNPERSAVGVYISHAIGLSQSYSEYKTNLGKGYIEIHSDKLEQGLDGFLMAAVGLNHELNHQLFDLRFYLWQIRNEVDFNETIELRNSNFFAIATEISAWFGGGVSLLEIFGRNIDESFFYKYAGDGYSELASQSDLYIRAAQIGFRIFKAYSRVYDLLDEKYGTGALRDERVSRLNKLSNEGEEILSRWLSNLQFIFLRFIKNPQMIYDFESFLIQNEKNSTELLLQISGPI